MKNYFVVFVNKQNPEVVLLYIFNIGFFFCFSPFEIIYVLHDIWVFLEIIFIIHFFHMFKNVFCIFVDTCTVERY